MPRTDGNPTTGFATRWAKRGFVLALLLAGCAAVLDQAGWLTASQAQRRTQAAATAAANVAGSDDCGYLKDEQSARTAQVRHRREISRRTEEFVQRTADAAGAGQLVPPNEMPRHNFVDDHIFGRMVAGNVASAPLCTDAEFLRRVTFDLTGRAPTPQEITQFLADQNPDKRDIVVDTLMSTPEYVDKWTMFYGDLLRNTAFASQINRYRLGRDAFHNYIKDFVATDKPWSRVASELIVFNGDSYVDGAAGFMVGSHVAGAAQDVYDGAAVEAGRIFLGLSSMDCLLCHDGAGHLDAVNLWGAKVTRFDAYGMAAFFARSRKQFVNVSTNPVYQKHVVTEATTGEYDLNTTQGNRSPRTRVNNQANAQPKYMFNGGGGVKAGENRREAFARYLVADPQFARAQVNYVWERLMAEALVSPSSTFDLARLSREQQMPDGWDLQPSNPELLQALADNFAANGFSTRRLIRTIVQSHAYQLSSVYPGEWKLEYVPFYARKFVRRLDAEEIHDAITRATGIPATMADPDNANRTRAGYRMTDDNNPVRTTYWVDWAMQLPEPLEPRTSGNRTFLNSFLNGDRDIKFRTDEPSILQALNMMNNGFVMGRIHQGNTVTVSATETRMYNSTVRDLLANTANTYDTIAEQLYLRTLARKPTAEEVEKLKTYYSKQTRQQFAENLQWVLLNKLDFLYNY